MVTSIDQMRSEAHENQKSVASKKFCVAYRDGVGERELLRVLVHVTPGSSRLEVGGVRNGALRVWVRARAVDGAATVETCRLVAGALGLKDRQVVCVRGFKSRNKELLIEGALPDLNRRILELMNQGAPESG